MFATTIQTQGSRKPSEYPEEHLISSYSVLNPSLFGKLTEEPIPPALRLAICLYRLSRGYYFYTIAEMSGLGVSTISSICQEVCQVLVDHLWNENVSNHMPQTEEEFKQKILDMEELWKNSFHAVGQL